MLLNKTILHISNGFCDSSVHSSLAMELDRLGLTQIVYCPVRSKEHIGKHQFNGASISFVYSFCIKSWYKYVYHYKRMMLYRDMNRLIDLKQVDIIHAPTLFSDGSLAYSAFRQYKIPYIVAVRNTDINLFIKKLKHTHYLGREIAKNATKIVFISKGEMLEFLQSDFVQPILKDIKDKIILQPNGIDSFWIQNISTIPKRGHNVLYIGDFSDNKNVCRLAQAVMELRKEASYSDARLIVIGGGKEKTSNTRDFIENHSEFIDYRGKIYDKSRLASIMNSCAVFAMPSIHETFGLVYIEALSQNLPVIYSKGQGIDGLFNDSVGESVDPLSVNDIKEKIKKVFSNADSYSNQSVDFSSFDWSVIASNYLQYYKFTLRWEDSL